MAISVPATGSASEKTVGSIYTSAITLEAGDYLLVATLFDSTIATMPSPPDWNAEFLDPITAALSGGLASQLRLWGRYDPVGGTSEVGFNIDTANTAGSVGALVIRGLISTPGDKSEDDVSLVGSDAPSSGATATLAQALEIAIGAVATEGPSGDTAGTWSNSFTAGPRSGTTGGLAATNRTISLGYKIVSATDALTAAKTGITSRPWVAAIQTFKGSTRVPSVDLPSLSLRIGL